MIGQGYYRSPIGDLAITANGDKITGVQFVEENQSETHVTPVIDECIRQLEA